MAVKRMPASVPEGAGAGKPRLRALLRVTYRALRTEQAHLGVDPTVHPLFRQAAPDDDGRPGGSAVPFQSRG